MKYSAHMYAEALAEAMKDGKVSEQVLVRNFLAVVEKNGDATHLHKILEEAARLIRIQEGKRKVVVESARALTAPQKKMVDQFLKKDDIVEEVLNQELIAGVRIVVDDEIQFDGSMRKKLQTLFKESY